MNKQQIIDMIVRDIPTADSGDEWTAGKAAGMRLAVDLISRRLDDVPALSRAELKATLSTLLHSLESGETCAETVAEQLTVPGWHERPTEPGLWAFPRDLLYADLLDRVSEIYFPNDLPEWHDRPCYGPIPEKPQ